MSRISFRGPALDNKNNFPISVDKIQAGPKVLNQLIFYSVFTIEDQPLYLRAKK